MNTSHFLQGRNTSSLTLSSAVSIGLHLPTLWAQTGESGVFAGENCPPSVEQLDVYELFRVLLNVVKSLLSNYCQKSL